MSAVHEAVTAGRSLWIDLRESGRLEDVDDRHCTLILMGKSLSSDVVSMTFERCRAAADRWSTVDARVGGVARFVGSVEEGDPLVLLLQAPRIREMKAELAAALSAPTYVGVLWIPRRDDFDYTPHVTTGRCLRGDVAQISPIARETMRLTHLCVCAGDAVVSFPLRAP